MRKALLLLTIAMSALLWMGRSEPAYAKTLACQGQDVAIYEPGFEQSDTALWSVTINGSKFTGGNLTAVDSYYYPPATCFYTLDSTSSFTTINGTVRQTLIWDLVSGNHCSDQFTDDVSVISNGAAGVMVDDNLEDDEVAGSGTCVWL